MHGLGNDFMVIDRVTQDVQIDPERICAWADRKTGIGFDQLLLLDVPTKPEADFWYRIYNADGSEAEQCGNGARCVTTFAHARNLTTKNELHLQTQGGGIITRKLSDRVQAEMCVPSIEPANIPFSTDEPALSYILDTPGGEREVTPVSIGNPHGVLFVDNVIAAPVEEVGAMLTAHARFPEGANIGFCQVVDSGFLRLRVFERGVGETRACGTGACAAVVASRLHDRVGKHVKVSLPGGKVHITWQGPGSIVTMTGPSTLVYEGSIVL
jgi:diaminopimelate epimerase|tara:strand:- start:971 stop:1777 length:807 start_codon:yes stop_codon:yes gene_type:complete